MDSKSKRHEMKLVFSAVILLLGLTPLTAFGANKLIVKGTDGTTDKFVVTDTGAVGVGTNAPQVPLHVRGATANDVGIMSHFVGTNASGGGGIVLFHNNDPAANSGMPQGNDRLGNILFGGYMADGVTRRASAGLSSYSDGTWTGSSTPSYLSFQTTPAGTGARVERMVIRGNGNIGLGTNNPTQKLEIDGGVKLNTATGQPACSATVRGTVWFTRSAAGVADLLEVCAKDNLDAYAWHALY
jgi:hypothetical protein